MIQAKKNNMCVSGKKKIDYLVDQELFCFYISFLKSSLFKWQNLLVIMWIIYKAVSFYLSRNVLNYPSFISLFVFCTILRLNLTFSTGKLKCGVKIKSNLFDILQQFLDEFGWGQTIWLVDKPETQIFIFLALSK